MALAVSDILAFLPALKAYGETPEGAAAFAALLPVVEGDLDQGAFGTNYTYAVALLTAHRLVSANPALGGLVAGGGVVQSVSIGGVSTTYASHSQVAASGPNGSTSYGVLYDQLTRGLFVGLRYFHGGGPGYG